MVRQDYFHICAKGADSRNFIICKSDYYAAFNLVGVCAANTSARVISFSIEDTHPHILLWGTREECARFSCLYETQYIHYVAAVRKGGSDLVLHCGLYPIGDDIDYLKNVAVYTIIQPTKDGKPVMPYDYQWGTGSLYFRDRRYTPIWHYSDDGAIQKPVPFGSLSARGKRVLLHSRTIQIPEEWLVCNGFILPDNYVDVERF